MRHGGTETHHEFRMNRSAEHAFVKSGKVGASVGSRGFGLTRGLGKLGWKRWRMSWLPAALCQDLGLNIGGFLAGSHSRKAAREIFIFIFLFSIQRKKKARKHTVIPNPMPVIISFNPKRPYNRPSILPSFPMERKSTNSYIDCSGQSTSNVTKETRFAQPPPPPIIRYRRYA